MRAVLPILKILGLIFLTTLIGGVFGFLLGSVEKDPAAIPWQSVPEPPEMPVEIVWIGGYGRNARSLVVEAESGLQYECCGTWPWVWKESASRWSREGGFCPSFEGGPLERPPGAIADCVYASQWEWVSEEYYVVQLEDGSLWRWRYEQGLTVAARTMAWGAFAGFILGVVLAFGTRPLAMPRPLPRPD